MKIRAMTAVVLASGAILLSGVEGKTSGASLIVSGTATLADISGNASGSEAITVNYSVSESDGVYTYSYVLNNPIGDVLLNENGSLSSIPEIVDAFSIGFNANGSGACSFGSQAGGIIDQDNGIGGLFWSFAAVKPGASSPTLTFESDSPPIFGNANALDANPPSPWSSVPHGQQIPVPEVEVPDSTSTLALLGGGVLLLGCFSTTGQRK
jgi:hypothetical protein